MSDTRYTTKKKSVIGVPMVLTCEDGEYSVFWQGADVMQLPKVCVGDKDKVYGKLKSLIERFTGIIAAGKAAERNTREEEAELAIYKEVLTALEDM